MEPKEKKSYKFALLTSLAISGLLTVITTLFLVGQGNFDIGFSLLYFSISFVVSFGVIQFRIERVIYRSIKHLRDTLKLLESSPVKRDIITTNVKSLTEEIETYAINKKIELESLKGRDDFRREFIGNVSHELKTPLFTIQGYIDTLLEGAADNEKLRVKYLERASKAADRLTYIIKDLDLITKLEMGELQLEPINFDIVQVVEAVFEMMEMRAAKKKITLTFDTNYSAGVNVYGDQEKIRQVVTNLVDNAIKYGKEDGTVEISIQSISKKKILLRVTDNGEGIPKEDLPRLFERFYRVDKSGNRKQGGSGLGLSIVKHIIEAHDQKIFVESTKEIGSEFSFTLQKSKDLHPNGEQE
ncbi:MAG: ATP-binding protein [Flavobacteriaceae bacterium]|jgi:two-component system phosphate regulon sensor histidine kinase PhoR|nr:ATP-binding protein [Flavobacteriaceae bacterium]NVJ71694.1 ATP-binding protein [Flavobacteriaceae bacterium]